MSTLYIASTNLNASVGTWWGGPTAADNSKFIYEPFTPGNDVYLDYISVYANDYLSFTPPTNFGVRIYSGDSEPSSLIATLDGPSTPTANAYNTYTPSESLSLIAGSQYWLGFGLTSPTADGSDTRVRLGSGTPPQFTTLGAGWSVGSNVQVINGTSNQYPAEAVIYSLYARPVCFLKGTKILMGDGCMRPVESIQPGMLVQTSHGHLPVKWVPTRSIKAWLLDPTDYLSALPIKIGAGALADNSPSDDLFVSAFHGIYAEEGVINASYLVNGCNIKRTTRNDFPEQVCYYHLEFEREVMVLANGAWACSYVNLENRRQFDNYPEFISRFIHVDMSARAILKTGRRDRPSRSAHKRRIKKFLAASR